MKYAIELLLDESAQDQINQVRQLLVKNGVHDEAVENNHISLACIEIDESQELISIIRDFASRQNKIEVCFSSVGSFMTKENVLFLAPIMNSELDNCHRNLINKLHNVGIHSSKYYDVDNWQPHSTLVINLSDEELFLGFRVLKENNILPIRAVVDRVDILQCDKQRYDQIAVFELQ